MEQISDRPLKDNLLDFLYLKKHYPEHVLISSIMGFSNEEWEYLAKASEDNGADMLELNFSCPHMCIEGTGHHVGKAFDLMKKFTETVKTRRRHPGDRQDDPQHHRHDRAGHLRQKRRGGRHLGHQHGERDFRNRPGRPGPQAQRFRGGRHQRHFRAGHQAHRPALYRRHGQMPRTSGLPLSGIGGIETWIDALEYLLLGATTLQVTTGIIHYGYRIVEDMIEGLSDFMAEKGIDRVEDLVGRALGNLKTTNHFDLERQGITQYDLDRCVGCGQCYIVCNDAAGQAIEWDAKARRPKLIEDKCLSCMICSFVCPVPGLITFKEMPKGWQRREAAVMDSVPGKPTET